jgi:hypothetical protein
VAPVVATGFISKGIDIVVIGYVVKVVIYAYSEHHNITVQ